MLSETFPIKTAGYCNSYVIFWLAIELIFRFFMQSLPVMNIKPLLVLPIKKESVIHFVLMSFLSTIFSLY
jgi:hypothetical protein